jgi:hypothetical protein
MSVQSLTKCLAEMAEDMDALRASLDEAQQQNVTLQLRVQQVCCLGAVLVHLIWWCCTRPCAHCYRAIKPTKYFYWSVAFRRNAVNWNFCLS